MYIHQASHLRDLQLDSIDTVNDLCNQMAYAEHMNARHMASRYIRHEIGLARARVHAVQHTLDDDVNDAQMLWH